MAKVYLAEDLGVTGPRRWNAVKIPDRKYRDEIEYRRMFEAEAALATQISHPHVCGAFEVGAWNGTPFFAMELLQGRTLLSLRKTATPCENPRVHSLRVARLIADACEGLQAIHDYGSRDPIPPRVVHRDISPDNLFLTNHGFVKVLDFGLAQTELNHDESDTDLLRGKISYIAPELLNRQVATSQSDVWGLGVVAWELLVGRPLFNEATDYETLVAVREQVIVAPSELVAGVPQSIDSIILRALQREPSARFESAANLGAALWDFMIAEKQVIHHVDLADWLAALFPVDQDTFTCLSSLEWTEDVQDICSPACSDCVETNRCEVVRSQRAVKRRRYWSTRIGMMCGTSAAALKRMSSRVVTGLAQEVTRASSAFLARCHELSSGFTIMLGNASRLVRQMTSRASQQLLANSNPGNRRKNPEYIE